MGSGQDSGDGDGEDTSDADGDASEADGSNGDSGGEDPSDSGAESDGGDGDDNDDDDDDGSGDGDGDGDGDTDDSTDDSGDDDSADSGDDTSNDDDPIIDFLDPSFDPPGGLTPAEVPQFIVFGFDDNRYTDGMKWVLDTFEAYKNPPGSGNPRTFDALPARVSFYFTTDSLDAGEAGIEDQWLRVAKNRHEIANHTHTHRALQDTVPWNWQAEIDKSNAKISELFGISETEILGIRAPFLQHDAALFDAIEGTQGMIYDCSVTHLPSGDGLDDWTFKRHIWPYTLDNDFYYNVSFAKYGSRPGVWEVPVYTMPYGASKPTRAQTDMTGFSMAGFDSTSYGTLKRSATDFYNSMKWALEFRMEEGSSRAPLTIGVHSDTYSEKHKDYDPVASLAQRRQAIVDFMEFASAYPEVRFVSARQMLQWMSNPVALGR